MTRLMGRPAPTDIAYLQASHNETQAREYFETAIQNGQAATLLADLNKFDGILRELGMQDTDECPIEHIRAMFKTNT